MYNQSILVMYLAVGVYLLLLVQNAAAGLTTRAVDSVRRGRQENRGNEQQVAGAADGELHLENTVFAPLIDSMIKDVQNDLRKKGLNEIQLPPMTSEFSRKFLGIRIHGKASIFDAVLHGLVSLHRTGVLHFKSEASTGDLTATFEVGIDHPTVHAKAVAKFMNIGPSGNIKGTFDKVIMKIVVRLTKRDSGLHAELDTFKITGRSLTGYSRTRECAGLCREKDYRGTREQYVQAESQRSTGRKY
ncbi:unnamed protein product [Allacma fusca]|uniref:Uncharacterized protein n=1 Tax=Allacma fusca TaxID=39272 RepID=A0A8J2J7J0_9HEXA|nr:unnamed protein product [Allacma fusca]